MLILDLHPGSHSLALSDCCPRGEHSATYLPQRESTISLASQLAGKSLKMFGFGRKKSGKKSADNDNDEDIGDGFSEFEDVDIRHGAAALGAGEGDGLGDIIAEALDLGNGFNPQLACSKCGMNYTFPRHSNDRSCYREPKLLECLHTFCTTCIHENMISRGGHVSCVACNHCTRLSLAGKSASLDSLRFELKSDHAVLNKLLVADPTAQGEAYAASQNTCQKCHKVCANKPSVHKHSLSSAANNDSDLNFDDLAQCLECDKTICVRCAVFGGCRNHTIKYLNEVAADIKRKLQQSMNYVSGNISQLAEYKEVVADVIQTTQMRSNGVKGSIKGLFNELHAVLDEQEQVWFANVDVHLNAHLANLIDDQTVISENILIATGGYKYAKLCCEELQDVQLLDIKQLLVDRVQDLSKMAVAIDAKPPEFSFHSDSSACADLAASVSAMGCVSQDAVDRRKAKVVAPVPLNAAKAPVPAIAQYVSAAHASPHVAYTAPKNEISSSSSRSSRRSSNKNPLFQLLRRSVLHHEAVIIGTLLLLLLQQYQFYLLRGQAGASVGQSLLPVNDSLLYGLNGVMIVILSQFFFYTLLNKAELDDCELE